MKKQPHNQDIEAGVFRRLLEHLQNRHDVQNIDLMELAGFCRNCLARWYQQEAEKLGVVIDKQQARQIVYDMPHHEWKKLYQKPSGEDEIAEKIKGENG